MEDWFATNDVSPFAASDWTITEVSSALGMKRRIGKLSEDKYRSALIEFQMMLETSFTLFAVARRHFMAAADYCNIHDLGLRSGDALHLAIAMEAGAQVVTLDKRFATAALALSGQAILL